jgi:ABC-type molybdate transport system substrate-binding protein
MLAYIIGENDMTRTVGALVTLAVCLMAQAVSGAEIKVYSTIGVKSALEELAPKFEKETGNKLNITWGLISAFTKRAQEGDVPDVLVVSRASIDGLIKDGKIAAGSDATLAKSVFAIAVKRGAPKPDISSAEALKSALLAARAVATATPPPAERAAFILPRCSSVWELRLKSKPRANFRRRQVLPGLYWSAARSTLPCKANRS